MLNIIYSSSTYNSIDSKKVASVPESRLLQNLQVSMKNDTMMQWKIMIKGLKLQLDGYEMRRADVIIGAHLLKENMNLDKLFMTLQSTEPLITITGLQAGVNEMISSHKIGKQLAKGELWYLFQCNSIKTYMSRWNLRKQQEKRK